jgi:hypothetical protein
MKNAPRMSKYCLIYDVEVEHNISHVNLYSIGMHMLFVRHWRRGKMGAYKDSKLAGECKQLSHFFFHTEGYLNQRRKVCTPWITRCLVLVPFEFSQRTLLSC